MTYTSDGVQRIESLLCCVGAIKHS